MYLVYLKKQMGVLKVSLSNKGLFKIIRQNEETKNTIISLDWCGSVGWALPHKLKGPRFDSWSGHMPGLWVQSQVRACP